MKINLKNPFSAKKKTENELTQQFNLGYQAAMFDCQKSTDELRAYYMSQIESLRRDAINAWLVDPEWVFGVSKTGVIQLNGTQITAVELKNLKSEVRAMKEFQIYKIIQHTLRQKAIEKAVLTPTDLYSPKGTEQVLAGKMMIWNLDLIKTIVNAIDKAK